MEIFACWTCKEFGHFSSTCPKRVRKTRKSFLSDEDEEFKASMERFLKDCDNELEMVKKNEVGEEIALVTIVDPKANHENVEVIINKDLQNEGETRQEQSSKPSVEPRVEITTPILGKNMIRNHPSEQIIRRKDKGVMARRRVNKELFLISQVEPKNVDEACKDDF